MTRPPEPEGVPRPAPAAAGRPLPSEGDPLRFDCPMCTRVQKLRLAEVRCESCGALLRVFDDPAAAREAADSARSRSRHLRELPGGLFVVAEL
ncbi:MAG: hypothetical protein ABR599_09390 [Gemmatimonadota bacterium]